MMKYIGDGTMLSTPIGGVPTRDLSDDEAKRFGRKLLLRSGLYVEVTSKPTKSAVKDAKPIVKEYEDGARN